MKLETLYVIEKNKFGKSITEWAEEKHIEVKSTEQKNSNLLSKVDGVVLFHEDHNFAKEDDETQGFLNKNNKPVHKVDINGTLSATSTNFTMWLERNRPDTLLFIGTDEIIKNEGFHKFLESLGD